MVKVVTRLNFYLLLFLNLGFFQSCVPTSLNNQPERKRTAATETPKTTVAELTFNKVNSKLLFWERNSIVIDSSISINENVNDIFFLKGKEIEDLLSSTARNIEPSLSASNLLSHFPFCLVMNFNLPQSPSQTKQLRLKATSEAVYNRESQSIERFFRLEPLNKNASASICGGVALGKNSITDPADVVFTVDELCSDCLQSVRSKEIELFLSLGNKIEEKLAISPKVTFLNSLKKLELVVQFDPTKISPVVSCSNTECAIKGFDCCVDGQCVKDGSEKPNAQDLDYYLQAVLDRSQNSANYKNWPNVYFICSKDQQEDLDISNNGNTGDEDDDTLVPVSKPEFELLKNYFLCLKDALTANPVYNRCSFTNPPAATLTGANAFVAIKDEVLAMCGCAAIGNDPPFTPENVCPSYGLKATYDPVFSVNDDDIRQVDCEIPISPVETPFQDLAFSIESRRVPHRFFPKNGSNIYSFNFDKGDFITSFSDYVKALDLTVEQTQDFDNENAQEGDLFRYLDSGNSIPLMEDFGMNAILGQMSLTLNKSLPAKRVKVELNKVYVITMVSGFYTPCPSCKKDSWFDNFASHPSSEYGQGLKAQGFSTNRSNMNENNTLGNYEDTIFGRACFLPPTMIPYSHAPLSSSEQSSFASTELKVQAQRLRRLQTQAALFSNGYQRDWFGFNYGALIGSFDGVKWFSIGQERIIEAESEQLFLAVNAPFGDLANFSEFSVSIIEDNGTNSSFYIPEKDFDPTLSNDHQQQNSGATCQSYHQCERDKDCITQLGWEYVCADISKMETLWPSFSPQGFEQLDAETDLSPKRLMAILNKSFKLGSSKKRCVYRGAGALCRVNPWQATVQDNTNQDIEARISKLLTCAPNFHCQDMSGSYFNNSIVRNPNSITPINFGQENDVLGRPLYYMAQSNGSTLTDPIQTNLGANATELSLFATQYNGTPFVPNQSSRSFGLCRPSKNLQLSSSSINYKTQHGNEDTAGRTDYISQVAPCSSVSQGLARVHSCPLLDERGDYVINKVYNFADFDTTLVVDSTKKTISESSIPIEGVDVYKLDTIASAGSNFVRDILHLGVVQQNACGRGSLHSDVGLGNTQSPFFSFEQPSLTQTSIISEPSIVQDACYRRAGAVCHTDLDCSPNRLHAEGASRFTIDYFGNTEAEKKYWEESLVCSQGKIAPKVGEENTDDYQLKDNKCCREIGKDLSMYTQVSDQTDTPIVERFSYLNPTQERRYSRYTVLPYIGSFFTPTGHVKDIDLIPPVHPKVDYSYTTGPADNDTAAYAPHSPFQWKTFNLTGEKNCCGGGWVRKFANGTHDWRNHPRYNFNLSNFACLNYRSEMAQQSFPNAHPSIRVKESPIICQEANLGGCTQASMAKTDPDDKKEIYPVPLNQSIIDAAKEEAETYGNDKMPNWEVYPSITSTGTKTYFHKMTTRRRLSLSDFSPYYPQVAASITSAQETVNTLQVNFPPKDTQGNVLQYMPAGHWRLILQLPAFLNITTKADLTNTARDTYIKEIRLRLIRAANNDQTVEVDGDVIFENCTKDSDGFADYDQDNNKKCLRLLEDDRTPDMCNPTDGTDPIIHFLAQTSSSTSITGNRFCYNEETGLLFLYRDRAGINNYSATTHDAKYSNVTPEIIFKVPDKGATPGNFIHYLNRLDRFDLLGIPQIPYEFIHCNTDRSKLVPGLFSSDYFTGTDAQDAFSEKDSNNRYEFAFPKTSTYSVTNSDPAKFSEYQSINADNLATLKNKVKGSPIFSENDFVCCAKLGKKVDEASQCCSNFSVADPTDSSKQLCRLPRKTDLNMYFNRFVSNDGTDESLPDDTRLTDQDFHPHTGYPLHTDEVLNKLQKLGVLFCSDGQAFEGAAIHTFTAEPNTGLRNNDPDREATQYTSIVDSVEDEDGLVQTGVKGHTRFNEGRHWNHHYYCGAQP